MVRQSYSHEDEAMTRATKSDGENGPIRRGNTKESQEKPGENRGGRSADHPEYKTRGGVVSWHEEGHGRHSQQDVIMCPSAQWSRMTRDNPVLATWAFLVFNGLVVAVSPMREAGSLSFLTEILIATI